MKKSIMLLFLMTSLAATAQIQKRSTTQKLGLSFGIGSQAWSSDYLTDLASASNNATGAGLSVGYGFSELFEPYITLQGGAFGSNNSGIYFERGTVSQVNLGAKFNFLGSINAFRPYATVGYLSQQMNFINLEGYDEQGNPLSFSKYTVQGGGISAGGGISYFFAIPVSAFIDGRFLLNNFNHKILIDNQDTATKTDLSTFAISIGVTYRFK